MLLKFEILKQACFIYDGTDKEYKFLGIYCILLFFNPIKTIDIKSKLLKNLEKKYYNKTIKGSLIISLLLNNFEGQEIEVIEGIKKELTKRKKDGYAELKKRFKKGVFDKKDQVISTEGWIE